MKKYFYVYVSTNTLSHARGALKLLRRLLLYHFTKSLQVLLHLHLDMLIKLPRVQCLLYIL